MKTKFVFPFILLIALFLFPKPTLADGIIIPFPPICDPGPCPPMPIPISQLEIRYHHVTVTIQDQVAVTHVDQVFYNPNDWSIEGTYIFPIPFGAAVTNFTLWIDGQPVQGKILDAGEARQTYEDIVRQMQDPALLEYADRDAMQARIFPISPGGERRIELEYSQIIEAENGLVRYIYPLNTEKFSTQPLDDVSVSVDVKSSVPIRASYSPSHPVVISKDGLYHFIAGYEETNVKPDSDFVLYYSIGENQAFHLLSYREPNDEGDSDGFFALLLAPRPDSGNVILPKDIILVLDRSGSMEGEKFFQAQSALRYILEHLNPEDRFNLIAFSTTIETFANTMQETSQVDAAISWVDRLSAVGSTDINRALLEAVSNVDQERPTYLIFLTDGLPTEGVIESGDILKNLESAASPNLRLFPFGVGYDVDTYLLDSLAGNHHGVSTYVLPGEKIDEILSAFYAKVSTPVLTDLELDFGDVVAYDLYPFPFPDLFDGSQIVVVGRYREGGVTDVTLTGKVNNQTQTFTFQDQIFSTDSLQLGSEVVNLQFIPRLWATRKIGYLLNQIRLQGPQQEFIDQIVHLSIRYGIVTPYTSYLVTEPAPLGSSEQNRIADEQFQSLEAAPSAPAYGQEAVEKAADQGEMAGSNIVAAPMPEASGVVRIVGSHTFILSDNVWIDTGFDPDTMQTLKVAFLSDDYFALATSRADLAAAFAIGSRVIVVSEGNVYEVVAPDVTTEPIEIPPTLDFETPTEDVLEYPLVSDELTAKPVSTPTLVPDSNTSTNTLPCLVGVLPIILVPFGLWYSGLPKMKKP
jgi:Ca-activated chloride channel family protein